MPSSELALPPRSGKPRHRGLTMVIDNGMPAGAFVDAIDSAAPYIDFVKFGWGTALVTPQLADKMALLNEHDIAVFFGGTLFEKFAVQDRFEDYLQFCHDQGCRVIEISNGTIPLPNEEKARFIARAASEFVVLSEVGYKDQERSQAMDAARWVEFIEQDLEAGASLVITEARESGRSGICTSDGEVRADLVESILASAVDPDRLIFEAPTKDLQTFFVTRLGADANLGNIPATDVLAAETLRLGLRGDTLLHFELERRHQDLHVSA
jgi:phosphosulfolactate synthase